MWSNGGYTEYDFMRMKQDAIQRAREMNRRASGGTGFHASPSAQNNARQQPNPVAEPPPAETRCPKCGRIIRNGKHVYEARPSSRGNPPQAAQPNATPFESVHTEYTPPPQESEKAGKTASRITLPLLGDIELDRDFLIIGGLLLVLLSEEGDQLLMLALLYIML